MTDIVQEELFASLGVLAKSTEQVEQQVLDEVLIDPAAEDAAVLKEGADTQKLSAHLEGVDLEIEAIRSVIRDGDASDWSSDGEDAEDDDKRQPNAGPSRSLQQQMMAERLTELQARRRRIKKFLRQATAAEGAREAAASDGSTELCEDNDAEGADEEELDGTAGQLVETARDRLVRQGMLTPFDRMTGLERKVQGRAGEEEGGAEASEPAGADEPHRLGRYGESLESLAARTSEKTRLLATTRHSTVMLDPAELPKQEREVRKVDPLLWRATTRTAAAPARQHRSSTLPRQRRRAPKLEELGMADAPEGRRRKRRKRSGGSADEGGGGGGGGSGSEYLPSEEDGGEDGESGPGGSSEEEEVEEVVTEGKAPRRRRALDPSGDFDDADEELYEARMRRYKESVEGAEGADGPASPSGSVPADVAFDGGLRVPGRIFGRLFEYQRTSVKWLWELHTQNAGGIIGDEMGLGKTIQLIAFLAALHHSGLYRPTVVVCPATVLRQWLRELRLWYPPFRVVILHDSARSPRGHRPTREQLVDAVLSDPSGVLLTSYDQLRLQRNLLLPVQWGMAVLDEGHKIRNPDSDITLVCKQLDTVHRIIMTGSPIQNRLSELWSLFDFIFPGKLGTLPVFQAQFAIPIQVGGYANATLVQVQTAYKCAVLLRDLIAPYLLRRRKVDVNAQLPKKTEQVLFCSLTKDQRELYRAFLASSDVAEILDGKRNALAGIDVLRKICNHPDLLERMTASGTPDYGNSIRSGKLLVVEKLLAHWKSIGSKVLLFSQTQQMLDILERMVQRADYPFHRMDGTTPVAMRSRLIDDFNDNPRVFVFLLTTKVGGLGVNLVGADKVLLYDPDWNPSTDAQARERAWRIGQTRDVTVYRLLTSGTIEEKVYHRQIYKNFLTNKVLRDPRQKRFFSARDIHDLFALADDHNGQTETGKIFQSVQAEVNLPRAATPPVAPRRTASSAGASTSGRATTAAPAAATSAGSSGSRGQSGGRRRAASGRAAARHRGSSDGGGGGGASSSRKRRAGADSAGGSDASGAVAAEEDANETHVLQALFDGKGLHSLMDHDKIEDASSGGELSAMAEAEANRIAQQAAEALRRSRELCMTARISTPTWTGRHGTAGVPSGPAAPQRRFGNVTNPHLSVNIPPPTPPAGFSASPSPGAGTPSRRPPIGAAAARHFSGATAGTSGTTAPPSSQLLSQMRSRQQAAPAAAAARGGTGGSGQSDDSPDLSAANDLVSRLVAFLEARGGIAPSAAMVEGFQRDISQAQAPLFKQLLKQVAELRPQPQGGKAWVLKPEFGGPGTSG